RRRSGRGRPLPHPGRGPLRRVRSSGADRACRAARRRDPQPHPHRRAHAERQRLRPGPASSALRGVSGRSEPRPRRIAVRLSAAGRRGVHAVARVACLALLAGVPALASAQPVAPAEGGAGAPRAREGSAVAGADLGFEQPGPGGAPPGWSLGDGAAVDGRVALEGTASLRLEAGAGRGARATLRLPPPRVEGNRIRFALFARAGDRADALELFLRIDGPDGLLYVDRRSAPLGAAAG